MGTVEIATAATNAATPSTTFAANMGPDLTTVYSGPVTVQPTGAAQSPGLWVVDIPLQTNFLYDPSSGNDLCIFSHIPPPATAPITGNPSLQLDVQADALCTRIFNSSTTVYPNATGTITTNHAVVVEITYVPAAGLYAGFSASQTTGPVGMTVNFTDTTFTSDPNGVTSWSWDLDGDGIVDSTAQNPSFTYNTCGAYTVSLTVTDATHPASTLTRTGYIQTGLTPITANFTQTQVGPNVWQFTDTSSPTPSSWAWDFDGDSIVDSTLQNPIWAYPGCQATANVTLTTTNSCNAPYSVTHALTLQSATASFTATPTSGSAPLVVQFTDTSTGGAIAWAWDFNGDSITDSTAQNPIWVYPTPGFYSVSLTINTVCLTASTTRSNYIQAVGATNNTASPELMEYQFNEIRGQQANNTASSTLAPAQGAVSAANWWSDPNRNGFNGNEAGFGCLGYRASGAASVNTGWTTAISGSMTVSFWLRKQSATASPFGYAFGNGTFRSFVGGAAGTGITFRGSSVGNVDSGFTVNGTLGVWQHLTLVVDDVAGQALWYNNGVASATVVNYTPGTHTYTSTTGFQVGALSTAAGSPIGAGYDMDDFRFYTRALTPAEIAAITAGFENPTASVTGSSCPGPTGTPIISASGGAPAQGDALYSIDLSNAENGKLAAIVFGFAPAAFGTLSLAPWIGPGCELQLDNAGLNFMITAANGASQPFPLPPAGFAGLHIYTQYVILGTTGAATQLLDTNIE